MGTYVYKVTGKKIVLADGTKANIAVFAYKPYYGWDADKLNSRAERSSGCNRADAYVKGKTFTGKVAIGNHVIETKRGTFTDDWFYNQPSIV